MSRSSSFRFHFYEIYLFYFLPPFRWGAKVFLLSLPLCPGTNSPKRKRWTFPWKGSGWFTQESHLPTLDRTSSCAPPCFPIRRDSGRVGRSYVRSVPHIPRPAPSLMVPCRDGLLQPCQRTGERIRSKGLLRPQCPKMGRSRIASCSKFDGSV